MSNKQLGGKQCASSVDKILKIIYESFGDLDNKHAFPFVSVSFFPRHKAHELCKHLHVRRFEYLEEEWALVLRLRAGRPEPVRKSICFCSGDVVAQSQRLLLQLLGGIVPGQQALSLTLQTHNIAIKLLLSTSYSWVMACIIYSTVYSLYF